MDKLARKRSEDPAQEHLRERKDLWNKSVKSLISQMIGFKKALNGRGEPKLGLPESNIKEPFPGSVEQFLSHLADEYVSVIRGAEAIIQEQEQYSQHRRKPQDHQSADDGLVSEAGFLDFFRFKKRKNEKELKIMLRAAEQMYKQFLEMESLLTSSDPKSVDKIARIAGAMRVADWKNLENAYLAIRQPTKEEFKNALEIANTVPDIKFIVETLRKLDKNSPDFFEEMKNLIEFYNFCRSNRSIKKESLPQFLEGVKLAKSCADKIKAYVESIVGVKGTFAELRQAVLNMSSQKNEDSKFNKDKFQKELENEVGRQLQNKITDPGMAETEKLQKDHDKLEATELKNHHRLLKIIKKRYEKELKQTKDPNKVKSIQEKLKKVDDQIQFTANELMTDFDATTQNEGKSKDKEFDEEQIESIKADLEESLQSTAGEFTNSIRKSLFRAKPDFLRKDRSADSVKLRIISEIENIVVELKNFIQFIKKSPTIADETLDAYFKSLSDLTNEFYEDLVNITRLNNMYFSEYNRKNSPYSKIENPTMSLLNWKRK